MDADAWMMEQPWDWDDTRATPPQAVKLDPQSNLVAAEGVEFVGGDVGRVQGLAVPGIAVVVHDSLAVQAIKGNVGELSHITPNPPER